MMSRLFMNIRDPELSYRLGPPSSRAHGTTAAFPSTGIYTEDALPDSAFYLSTMPLEERAVENTITREATYSVQTTLPP